MCLRTKSRCTPFSVGFLGTPLDVQKIEFYRQELAGLWSLRDRNRPEFTPDESVAAPPVAVSRSPIQQQAPLETLNHFLVP